MTKQILTQAELKEQLQYNPETGLFVWAITKSRITKIGSVAGRLKPTGYIHITIRDKTYLAHRLAFLYMEGYFPPKDVDHINHIRHDNRFINLRKVTKKENQRNQSKFANNKSGITGVCWHKRHKKWTAYIHTNNKNKYIYWGLDYFDACCSRKSAEKKYGYHENHGA